MVTIGCKEVDDIIGGFGQEITCIYGPATSGKTTFALLAAIETAKQGKRVLFIDTEGGFSVDRLKQLVGNSHEEILQNIFVLRVKNFDEQVTKLKEIFKVINKFSLVVIDSLSVFYRKELHLDLKKTNNEMIEQLRIFSHIVKDNKIPVILTNQVYAKPGTVEKMMVGGNMIKKFAKKLISLDIKPRKLKVIKPEEKEIIFKIVESGIIL
ncbi:MAG: AAA family ATPase [Candidatus Nanoarchaeia archaeon]|nr:AAA family ATPase [Candidatus Nanoarchaeia archaeon]